MGEKSPEIVNLSLGFPRPFAKCMESNLVFKPCMFSISMSDCKYGERKKNTWDVFDFDILKTSA